MSEDKREEFVIAVKEGKGALIRGFSPDGIGILEVSRGEGVLHVGTELVSLCEGDIVYISPSRVFSFESETGAAAKLVTFAVAEVEKHMYSLDAELFYMFLVQSETKMPIFKPIHPAYEQLAFSISEAVDEYSSKDVCFGLAVRANVYMLICSVLRAYFYERGESERQVYHNVMRLRPALEYIKEHCAEKIYIDTLAEMINVSADYFTKMFKESIGKTPVDYINAVRVNKSLELLSETDIPINEIAEKAGFANPNYFHKIFKSYMDTSPLNYRKGRVN